MSECPLSVGDTGTLSRCIDKTVYDAFLICSGDVNPLHFDDNYARSLGHPGKLMHGAMLNAMISGFVGTGMVVEDTMCLMQKVNFKRPFYLNDTVVLKSTVKSIQDSPMTDKWLVELSLRFSVENKTIATGSAEVMVGSRLRK